MATPILSEFKTLRQFQQTFRTESDCIRFLESKLWENGIPVSPFVPSSKVYNRSEGLYRCSKTGKNFNIRKGTFLDGSKIPLLDWFSVIFFSLSDKQGMNAMQVMNLIRITKDAVCGIYNHVSRKHLQRYCDEVTFRYNTRKVSKKECFTELINNSKDTRITY